MQKPVRPTTPKESPAGVSSRSEETGDRRGRGPPEGRRKGSRFQSSWPPTEEWMPCFPANEGDKAVPVGPAKTGSLPEASFGGCSGTFLPAPVPRETNRRWLQLQLLTWEMSKGEA